MRSALSLGNLSGSLLAPFLLFMVLAPVLVRILEQQGMEVAARVVAYTGYLWMGFLFLFFSASLAFDLYQLLLQVAGFISHQDLSALSPDKRVSFYLPLAYGIVTGCYGYFEALDIRTERVAVVTPKITPAMGKLTIVQVSDVHLGLIVRKARLTRIVEKIKSASPDILVSTGDLVDGQINRMAGLAETLNDIRPRLGKFAVTGNHEVYAGLKQALDFTEHAGFKVLRGERTSAGGVIDVAGVDDPAVERVAHSRSIAERTLLAEPSADKFVLLLKHRPVIEKESLGHFDLQLSGHVHKGQLFPFNLVTHLFYPVKSGYSLYSKNSALYVSRGTGTWGPPIRFLAPPEITVIELIPSAEKR
ncbi:MAG TPA: metallophosphoesterase [Geobacteraceae bacterium]